MKTFFISVVLILLPNIALAGVNAGVRGGVTLDPDQVHVGGHLDFSPIAGRVGFRPNVEVGFGDDLLVLAMNLEGVYRFQKEWQTWSPYAGLGYGINRVDPDNDQLRGDARTESGLLIVSGIERGLAAGGRFFVEAKAGLGNTPDLKFTAGWTFAG